MTTNASGSNRSSLHLKREYLGFIITGSQVVADFITVALSYYATYFWYNNYSEGRSPQRPEEYVWVSVVAAVLYLFLLEHEKLYRREISLLNIKELKGIFRVGFYAAVVVFGLTFYVRSFLTSRLTFTIALIAAPVLLYLQRQIFYYLHIQFHQRGISQQRAFIYGASHTGVQLAKRLLQSPALGIYPLGFLDDDTTKHGTKLKWRGACPKDGVPVLGSEDFLDRALEKFDVDLVFIALPTARFDRNREIVEHCVKSGLTYAIVPNDYEKLGQRYESFEIGGIPLLRRKHVVAGRYYLILKRIIDFSTSSVLLVALAPLVLIIGALIKFDSSGPIFFKQKRVGLNGKEFSLYKFRSMYVQAPQYAVTPNDSSDPRITRIGRWLRRTSLDELAQIYNVWRGDMSFVGPRPEMPFIVAQYNEFQRQRLVVKPGITGVWQISAVRAEPIHANIEYDFFYIDNCSLLVDFAIAVKTVLSVIRGIGAI